MNMGLNISFNLMCAMLCFHLVSCLELKTDVRVDNEPEFQYATVLEINTRDIHPLRKGRAYKVQYQVTTKNESFTITLRQNENFFRPDCMVHIYLPGGEKDVYPCSQERLDCYYTGSSDAHNDSWVAANICNGLNGVISFDNTSLFIEPVNIKGSTDGSHGNLHVMYRFHGDEQSCPIEGRPLHVAYSRQKRAIPTRYIRTRLVVDPTMYHFHRSHADTIAYTMMAFNIANTLYADPSIGTNIHLTLTELHVIKTYNNFTSELTENVNKTLKTFCDWQADPSRFQREVDCSILLTRLDLEADNGEKGINGFSNPKSICNSNLHCAVVEDEGPIMGVTLAHEIGHLLGLTHDTGSNGIGIMSSGGWSGDEAYTWSQQSALELQLSLRSTATTCLKERLGLQHGNIFKFPLPGTLFTADQQCKMRYNNSYIYYRSTTGDPCKNIACRYGDMQPLVISSPLMDGTDCNNTKHWCIRGKCVPIDQEHDMSPVNGAWSAWDTNYTPCSRSCGGGVQIIRRHCNNPPPQYGGKECSGISSRERICKLQACEADYRSQQCLELQQWNGSSDGVQKWNPLLGTKGNDSCTIYCNDGQGHIKPRFVSFFKDGTECLSDRPAVFSRCVDGKCLEFGCDGMSRSGLKYDTCGVCNGTGSTCVQVSGKYKQNAPPKIYTNVTIIPAGSSSLSIVQGNKYAFLSILVDGRRILNTNQTKTMSALFNLYGIEFQYRSQPERIEIQGKITKYITLQVFRLWDYRRYSGVTPTISYIYYVPKSTVQQSYAWAVLSNQSCTVSCGTGVRAKTIKCMSVNGQYVDNFYCDINNKPEVEHTECNTQPCPPSWKNSEWSNCSAPCGEGTKSRSVSCVQNILGVEQVLSSHRCAIMDMPTNVSRCNNVCEWKPQKWSECTRTCGEGYRVRRVSCFHSYGNHSEIDVKFCNPLSRPDVTQRCNHGPCYVLDGTCVDKRSDCSKYYQYETSACDGSNGSWMTTNCIKTCGICANGSCVDEEVCKSVDPNVDACSSYGVWMKQHCPKTCNICQDCVDCSKYDKKFCTDSQFELYMRRNCSKTCTFCQ